jgi:HAD superfamily hydrolase (TIGR01509 family)
LTGF